MQHCQPALYSQFGITEQPTERHHGTRFQHVNFIFGFSEQHGQAIDQCAWQRASRAAVGDIVGKWGSTRAG
jgi:hypothetical protein